MSMNLPQHKYRHATTELDLVKAERPIDTWRACVWKLTQDGFTPEQIGRALECNAVLVRIQINEWEKAPPGKDDARD